MSSRSLRPVLRRLGATKLRARPALLLPVLLLAAGLTNGCALFEPQASQTAVPAPAVSARPARPPAPRPRNGEQARLEPGGEAPAPDPAGVADTPPDVAPATATEPPSQEIAAPVIWRVVADRIIGCAVPDTLRLLRSNDALSQSQPRIVAQARREGGCLSAFRVSEWILVRAEGDVVRLRLSNPGPGVPPIELFFLRRDVTTASLPVATG